MGASAFLAPLFAFALAGAAEQADELGRVGAFRAIELRGGGAVTVRHGSTPQLTIRQGSAEVSRIEVIGDRLVIERCRDRCPRGYRLEVEIVAPAIGRVAVSDGGVIALAGNFPAQASVATAVSDGGVVDIRPLAASRVRASVQQGGVIYTRPLQEMEVAISDGGLVTYWGDARVRSAIDGGGMVRRGAEADAARPFAELGPRPLPLLAPPPVPAVPPLGVKR